MSPRVVQCSVQDAHSIDAVRRHVKLLATFLADYKWLTDAYLSDYFVLEHAHNIKPSWWEALKRMHIRELASFLKPDHWEASHVWPLSLLAFRASIHSLPLLRLPVDATPVITGLTRMGHTNLKSDPNRAGADTETELGNTPSVDIQDGQCLLLNHCYRRHVKPKKQHEIIILATAIQQLSHQMSCSHVVDIGAGQGHLSRLLSYGYGLHVTTIEAASCHAPKAQKFDGEVERDISRGQCISRKKRKKLQNGSAAELLDMKVKDGPAPSHVVAWIDADISVGQFLERVREASDLPAIPENLPALNHNVEEQDQNGWHQNQASQFFKANSASELAGNAHGKENLSIQKHCKQELGSQKQCNGELTSQHQCKQGLEAQHHLNDVTLEKLGITAEVNPYICSSTQKQKCNDQNGVVTDCLSFNWDQPAVGEAGYNNRKQNDVGSLHCTQLSSTNVRAAENERIMAEDSGVPQSKSNGEAAPLVLTGLHACGDLTPTMLRVFVSCPEAQGLASVGCCYMKMDIHELNRGDRELGYPMSDYLGTSAAHTLSWEAREMACHFIDAYYDRLIEAQQDPDGQAMAHLRTHCYRAALQEIINDKDPSIQHGSIKLTLKKAHRLPFTEYAAKALGRLDLDPSLSDVQTDRAARRQDAWHEVVAFYVFRLSLAPLVESLILLDRVLYLAENGINSAIVPVFDPSISPRNFVLLAAKDGLPDTAATPASS